ncbi:protein-L-isoaspartate(D-aspartate) O-methyltransferase [Robertkochia aurantiaca]|uniref:protein-L-isoaspartate(D-aspartate) O-methyltransferase n=1 Tax=Robertkochia aurantiaca TaxID=2873700 RepID=UPI001CCBEBD4|nr:protein-L-isoaspartate(D-aspartate) O-methyltransferase [Robertkochia sp. 3YJGBD-33]
MRTKRIVASTKYLIFILLSLGMVSLTAGQNDYAAERNEMVEEQIRNRGIADKDILRAMKTVERHKLVPPEQRRFAYDDRPLPIGHGQTISQPYIVAFMTDVIDPRSDMKVLEVGTGSGYQAAVLAEIVSHVYTIEIIEPLAKKASDNLRELGYDNITVKHADGYFGWKEHAPFDAIIVTAAASYIPPELFAQLRDDGKMIIPVGANFAPQQLVLVTKRKNGKMKTKNLMPVRFVPFTRD